MRELIYVPVIHEVPDCHYLELNEQEREDVDAFERNDLQPYWIDTNRWIRLQHAKTPIHKVYREGFFPGVNLDDVVAEEVEQGRCMGKPVQYLISQGALLMATEHPALGYLARKLEEMRLELDIMPDELAERFEVNQGLELARLHLEDEWYLAVEQLCRGETTFDITRLMDKYVAQRINETLLEGERGMLLMGAAHKVHEVLAYEVGEGIVVTRYTNSITEEYLRMLREAD